MLSKTILAKKHSVKSSDRMKTNIKARHGGHTCNPRTQEADAER